MKIANIELTKKVIEELSREKIDLSNEGKDLEQVPGCNLRYSFCNYTFEEKVLDIINTYRQSLFPDYYGNEESEITNLNEFIEYYTKIVERTFKTNEILKGYTIDEVCIGIVGAISNTWSTVKLETLVQFMKHLEDKGYTFRKDCTPENVKKRFDQMLGFTVNYVNKGIKKEWIEMYKKAR